ncbi:MAG: RagB/SusD family nutrient uptake outer membrane protein, partial [Bacteroidota bacterium]
MFTLVALTLTNCGDLDIEPVSVESGDTAYDTPAKMEAALIGTYDVFGGGSAGTDQEWYEWDFINFEDMRADNAYAGGDGEDLFAIDQIDITAFNRRLDWHWTGLYSAIRRANNVLERAPLIPADEYDPGRFNQIIGEALYLRAYHYFQLVNLFSGVPLVLETPKSIEPEDLEIERSTSEEVYAQILEDLNMALTFLPDTYSTQEESKFRATSGSANALAAKVNLQKPNPDVQAALNHILALESSSANYRLLDNYDHLFDGMHEYNEESIFEIPYSTPLEGSIRPVLFLPPSLAGGNNWRKFTTPSHDLVDAFQNEGDIIRFNSSILFESVGWIDEFWGNQENSNVPFVYKWRIGTDFASPNNHMLIRYADIVLLKAEALAKLGRLGEAADEVNRVRSRVNLPDLTNADMASESALIDAILLERRLELAFEGHRW